MDHHLRLNLTAHLAYEAMNEQLTALHGKQFDGKHFWERFTLRDAKVYGGGDQVVVALSIDGRLRGTLYLVGTLRYDPLTYTISVPSIAEDPERGLRFSVETTDALTSIAKCVFNSRILAEVQSRCQWTIADQVSSQAEALSEAFERATGGSAALSNVVLQLTTISAQDDELLINLLVTGVIERERFVRSR